MRSRLKQIAITLAVVAVLLVVSTIQLVQTDWFRTYVREKIIASTEEALGGRVEIASFTFDWRHLRAEVKGFVIHGTEPASAAPFLQAADVQVDLALFSGLSRLVGVKALRIDRPQANVMTLPNGSLNIPQPKKKSTNDTSALETVVDLAVGHFELNSGTVRYNDLVRPLDVRGENLRAQLAYSILKRGYEGQLSMQPLYVVQGRNTPVVFTLNVPVVVERDKVSLNEATISTPLSQLKISGSLANLKQPESRVRVNGFVSVADLNQLASLSLAAGPGLERVMIDTDAVFQNDSIQVDKLHLVLGGSRLDASGSAKDAAGRGDLAFNSTLKLEELARLAKSNQGLNGVAQFEGTTHFDGKLLEFEKVRLRAFGGELNGHAKVENFRQYSAAGQLRQMNLQTVMQRFGMKPLPYDGDVNGAFEVNGELEAPRGGLEAKVELKISPGRRGLPLSGQVNAEYAAADGIIRARESYLALPHSRLNFAGSLQNGLKFELNSQDLRDLFAALPGAPPAVKLTSGGSLSVAATVTGSVEAPLIAGHAAVRGVILEDRQFDTIATDFSAERSRLTTRNGVLTRGTMQTNFAAGLGLVNWSPRNDQAVSVTATVNNGDLADVLALAGQKSPGYSGALSSTVNIAGTVGNPTGSANVAVTKGTLADEPFDELQVRVALEDQVVRVPAASFVRGSERVDVTAEFRHPRESFERGHVAAHVVSNRVELGGVKALQARRPGVSGLVQADANVEGELGPTTSDFRLTKVSGNVGAKELVLDGEKYGDVTAKASTASDTVTYELTSNFANSQLRANGRTQLKTDFPTDLNATLSGLPIERVLAAAKRRAVPARGVASGTLHLTGTLKDPHGEGDLELRNAVLYDEPVERLRLQVVARSTSLEVTRLEATAGPAQVTLNGRFDHPAGVFDQGTVAFQLKSSGLDLARIRNVQIHRPGLAGVVQLSGEGKGELLAAGPDRFTVEAVQVHLMSPDIKAEGRSLGKVEVSANGTGEKVEFALESGLAKAGIRGKGTATLRGDFPVNAEVTFDDLSWANLQPLLDSSSGAPNIDGVTSGRLTVTGPVANVKHLTASVRLTKLQVNPVATTPAKANQALVLQNQGDIVVSMTKGQIRVESAHVTGRATDINVTGTGSLAAQTLDFRVNGTSSLTLLKMFSPDIHSEGTVTLAAVIQGTMQKPLVNGKLELRDASVTSGDLPVGLSKANGVIAFDGTNATIQTLTGEAGGGRISLSGSVTRGDVLRFALRANASGVRVRVQPGVSVVTSANLSVAGTSDASRATGLVTIDKLTYLPQTDISSILTRSAPPVQGADSTAAMLQNMTLDILVRTSALTSVQASLAQNLQVNADLRVRGRASQPGITGSVQMNHGELAFLGSTYRLSSGTISFYNPNRVEPVLNITLETEAKGVTVVLTVTGSIDNMKLSYTSDPPLQFEEIVALLAAGKSPTSDPTLLANQPTQPEQTFLERGETALISKALADPISSRLQRVFGVSQLKIDPNLTSGSQLPQARVTLQQQVASNLLFTYVTALDNPNTQIIRIELSINPQWSAVANRDENGIVSVNLLYKKQFR